MLHIKNATIQTPDRVIERGSVLVDGQRIAAVGPAGEMPAAPGAREIDATGLTLVPGFIELQLNGAFGHDFTDDPSTIWQVGEQITRYGVTAFLPTIITSPLEKVDAGRTLVTGGAPAGYRGAIPLGLHVEGPFLNPKRKGAHNAKLPAPADARGRGGMVPRDRRPAGHHGARTAGRARGDRRARRARDRRERGALGRHVRTGRRGVRRRRAVRHAPLQRPVRPRAPRAGRPRRPAVGRPRRPSGSSPTGSTRTGRSSRSSTGRSAPAG